MGPGIEMRIERLGACPLSLHLAGIEVSRPTTVREKRSPGGREDFHALMSVRSITLCANVGETPTPFEFSVQGGEANANGFQG